MHLTAIVLIALASFALAEPYVVDESNGKPIGDDYKQLTVNVSVVPGLSYGSLKYSNKKIINDYSLNLIAGRAARLNKFELGGVWNRLDESGDGFQLVGGWNQAGEDFSGLQIAGLLNTTGRDMSGMQYANLVNYAKGDMVGLQYANLFNYAGSDMTGMQFAGIANLSRNDIVGLNISGFGTLTGDSYTGMGLAGFGIVARRDIIGLTGSGFGTVAGGDLIGLHSAGFCLVARRNMIGVNEAGFINVAGASITGLNFAGGFNLAERNITGLSASGAMNISGRSIDGMALAGLANIAPEIDGVAIAPINFAREISGTPIGLISYSGRQGVGLEVFGDVTGRQYAALRTGTRSFYNRIIYGVRSYPDDHYATVGFGIGQRFKRHGYVQHHGVEMLWTNYEKNLAFRNRANTATVLKFIETQEYSPFEHFTLFVGPTLNFFWSRGSDGSDYNGWIWSKKLGSPNKRVFVGLDFGIRYDGLLSEAR